MVYDAIKAGGRIREIRKRNGLSQREMAQKLAAIITNRVLDKSNGKSTVSQMERGARGITLAYAFAYADIFNVSLDYVLGRSDGMQEEIRLTAIDMYSEIFRDIDRRISKLPTS